VDTNCDGKCAVKRKETRFRCRPFIS
jgi:hypothetical protein